MTACAEGIRRQIVRVPRASTVREYGNAQSGTAVRWRDVNNQSVIYRGKAGVHS